MQIRPVIEYYPNQPLLLSINLKRWNAKKKEKKEKQNIRKYTTFHIKDHLKIWPQH